MVYNNNYNEKNKNLNIMNYYLIIISYFSPIFLLTLLSLFIGYESVAGPIDRDRLSRMIDIKKLFYKNFCQQALIEGNNEYVYIYKCIFISLSNLYLKSFISISISPNNLAKYSNTICIYLYLKLLGNIPDDMNAFIVYINNWLGE